MKLRLIWPGRTKDENIRILQAHYLRKINRMEPCEIVETKEARGMAEKHVRKIKSIEAAGIEKQMRNDYSICLSDRGKELSSVEFAQQLQKLSLETHKAVAFVVGGFLGLEERILEKANLLLSLSRMTFSHEMTRIILMEQIYRALCISRGTDYAK